MFINIKFYIVNKQFQFQKNYFEE